MDVIEATSRLREFSRNRGPLRGNEWVASLEERKREELEFHNEDRPRDATGALFKEGSAPTSNRRFYSIIGPSAKYREDWLARHVPGRVFLDYACGNGAKTIQAAKSGAELAVGIDISDASVQNATEFAREEGVSDRCLFFQADCEDTSLPGSVFDVVLCSGMLHHLDLDRAYPELARLLRPGGRVLAIEALGHNPLFQAYRDRTPHLRTEWEAKHILKVGHIEQARRWFEFGEIRYWHLAAVAAAFLGDNRLSRIASSALHRLDIGLLSLRPFQRMAWQVTFELIRPAD